MKKFSAGILIYRKTDVVEAFLVHPGGPFWAKKDIAAWSIPKGEHSEEEDTLSAAKREFAEEVGQDLPKGELIDLGDFKVSSGKVVHAWAVESDIDAKHVKSNLFEMEWPPKSGKMQEFPEVDKAGWFPLALAIQKIVKGQVPIVEKLAEHLGVEVSMQVAPIKEAKTKAQTDKEQTSLF
jgi:predicted NUDIX family NTP pyrophosphohydrolase